MQSPSNTQNIPPILGNLQSLTIADPAAGFNWSYTLPNGYRYQLQSINFLYQASGVVVARFPYIVVDNLLGIDTIIPPNASIAAGQLRRYIYRAGQFPSQSTSTPVTGIRSDYQSIPLNYQLDPGWIIRTDCTDIDAADQLSSIRLTLHRWIL